MILRTADGSWCCTRSGDVYELRRPDGQKLKLEGQRAQSFASDLGKKYERGEQIKNIFSDLWRIYV